MSTENRQNAAGGSPRNPAANGGASSRAATANDGAKAPSPLGEPGKAAEEPGTILPVPEQVVQLPAAEESVVVESGAMPDEGPSISDKVKTLLIGKPRDLEDKSVFTHISLIAFLAWVGLGADGLSSTSYGPEEAFVTLGQHSYLAIFLALATAGTVFIISACYSHLIEEFPNGGGYVVASKLLGRRIGVVSGCALMVDYVLTVTVSIAAAGDAIFGLLDLKGSAWEKYFEFGAIGVLTILNLRGVKESIKLLLPIFIVFLVTHIVVVAGAIGLHLPDAGHVAREVYTGLGDGIRNPEFGLLAMLLLFLQAYSMGAGTYTGIEAVSNSMSVMREPRVFTAKRTMVYMAISLALMAGGLVVAYLLLGIKFNPHKTMNLLLTEAFVKDTGWHAHWSGQAMVFVTLLSEGALLIVAAQAGFIGGPRVLANMAQDSWVPRWYGNLSERLATHNGIILMGLAAMAALYYTGGSIKTLVVMYSINVFVTFSLSMIGMCKHWYALRRENPLWRKRLILFVCGGLLCTSILVVSIYEKFYTGGWVTISVTGICVALCFFINHYYNKVGERLRRLDESLGKLNPTGEPTLEAPDPSQPAAVVLVGNYSGLGIHTMLNAIRFAPDHFRSFIFISTGVIDSGAFKGAGAMESLKEHIADSLEQYVDLARRLGMPATSYMRIGTDAVDELEELCLEVVQDFPKATFFAGQLVFQKDNWMHRLLHNQTAYSLQRRLQWAGFPMVILPTRVR
ncbi:MAG: amino acid permease [Pirellulales bacterium]|nr:amino acid permease [Pirellulales bacterium]